jgi:hypothetical protein
MADDGVGEGLEKVAAAAGGVAAAASQVTRPSRTMDFLLDVTLDKAR